MQYRFVFLAVFIVFCSACATKYNAPTHQRSFNMPEPSSEYEATEEAGEPYGYKRAKRKRKSPSKNILPSVQQQQPERMIHYNGYAKLKALKVEETIVSIVDLARRNKGALESRSRDHVTIRVPRKTFESVFDEILSMGEVLKKSVTAEDVTEAFTSVELRLKTAKTTRDRLLVLLEKAKDETEKMGILKQIQRLNEDIDTMDAQLRILSGLANHSKISVEIVPKQQGNANAVKNDIAGFKWIAELTPFQNGIGDSGKSLVLTTPKGMVRTTLNGSYRAESADGSFIRSVTLKNNPKGDSEFWQKAIKKRLESGFGKSALSTIGSFYAVKFDAVAQQPYIYIIAVRANQKTLDVVEVYYPNAQQQQRYEADIKTALVGGEG